MLSTPPPGPRSNPRSLSRTPEERVKMELSKISDFDEASVRSEFQDMMVSGPVAALKTEKEKARVLLRAYNGDKDEGQNPDRAPVDAAIVAMGESAGRFTSQVRQYFTVARGEALRAVIQDPVLESTVINALQTERPEAFFNQLIAVVTHPVRNLQVKYLGGAEPTALALDEAQAISQLENSLVEFVREADVKARETLRAHLLEQYEAEEKAQKAAKAMEILDKKIVAFAKPLLNLHPDGELLSEFLAGRDVETFMMGALAAFRDLSGVQFPTGHTNKLNNALQTITPSQEAVRKYDDAFARKSRYEPIDGSSLALSECVEAARLMAEAKEEFLKDLLEKLLTAFRNLTAKDALQEDGQEEDVLRVNRDKVFDDMEVKLIVAIEDQFTAEIRAIQPLDVTGMPGAVAARVEAAVADLSGRLDQMPNQPAIVAAIMAALTPRLNAPVQPTIDTDVIAREVVGQVLKIVPNLLVQLGDPDKARRTLKNALWNGGSLTQEKADELAGRVIALIIPAPVIARVEVDEEGRSDGWDFGPINLRRRQKPMNKWTKRALIGALTLGGMSSGAYMAEQRWGALSNASEAIQATWSDRADEVPTEQTVEEQVPSVEAASSVWADLSSLPSFPSAEDTTWVKAVAGASEIPSGFSALIVECTNKEVAQLAGYPSTVMEGEYWNVKGSQVKGFQAFPDGQDLQAACTAYENGIFAAQLIPEPAAQ